MVQFEKNDIYTAEELVDRVFGTKERVHAEESVWDSQVQKGKDAMFGIDLVKQKGVAKAHTLVAIHSDHEDHHAYHMRKYLKHVMMKGFANKGVRAPDDNPVPMAGGGGNPRASTGGGWQLGKCTYKVVKQNVPNNVLFPPPGKAVPKWKRKPKESQQSPAIGESKTFQGPSQNYPACVYGTGRRGLQNPKIGRGG